MIVARVPGSTANLGPGFDALAMALAVYAELGVVDEGAAPSSNADVVVDDRHPAEIAFRAGGGQGRLWLRSPIPSGRGLGFSAAARVGGLLLAAAQAGTDMVTADGVELDRMAVLATAIELEGHADNAAAALFGGVVATAGGRVLPIPLAVQPAVVVWVPASSTSTQRSRGSLPATVSFSDAAFNVGRTALLVAALVNGEIDALRTATEDRLHQDGRFAADVPSREALAAGLTAGAWAGWLSGSGPSVALLCEPAGAETIAAAIDADVGEGQTSVLGIDTEGATVTAG